MSKNKKATYRDERQKVLEALKATPATSDDYPILQKRLRELEEADNIRKTKGLTADTVLKVTASVLMTAGLVFVESKVPLSSTLVKLLPRIPHP